MGVKGYVGTLFVNIAPVHLLPVAVACILSGGELLLTNVHYPILVDKRGEQGSNH